MKANLMGKARPVSLFPLDLDKAMRGLLAVPKEAVEPDTKPDPKKKSKRHAKSKRR
jgi:hypothetical protein